MCSQAASQASCLPPSPLVRVLGHCRLIQQVCVLHQLTHALQQEEGHTSKKGAAGTQAGMRRGGRHARRRRCVLLLLRG